ncbi:MAG: hypothetical protein B6241_05635 [Spirochaetaceae bacterium 4572_59]|nr:MAG: hypothetical protein B6241_05635 [Spirochaetaceae bacterium 4572_59]
MKLLTIEKLLKKDTLIYYRNQYEGTALFSLLGEKQVYVKFRSSVEIKPTGERDVSVELLESIDYPLIPILQSIKSAMREIDQKG